MILTEFKYSSSIPSFNIVPLTLISNISTVPTFGAISLAQM